MNTNFAQLETNIDYQFQDAALLRQALIHPSFSSENGMERYESNQRLEFLGDAVLELIVSDHLYRSLEKIGEGELTRRRASLVFEAALCVCAKHISLGDFLFLGKGEDRSGGREKPSILSDAFEALIGAIYLDGGFWEAKAFIKRHLLKDIDALSLLKDGKSVIQEYFQKTNEKTLSYETTEQEQEAAAHRFHSVLLLDGEMLSEGSGQTKKAAEQNAALAAIRKLRIGM